KVEISESGDSTLLAGEQVDKAEFDEVNAKLEAEGRRLAKGAPVLLGITKASLQSESFLSGASFQETTKVLTEASLAGKSDDLQGLKENVLLGHLIPVGTGFTKYTGMEVVKLAEPPAAEAPTVEQQLEEAAQYAEAAGAQRADEIETTIGESRLVAQLLGEDVPSGGN
ncbi:MAG: DNA-directed RNA polymerase subunit beta', partial [Planctomycetota bacterium]